MGNDGNAARMRERRAKEKAAAAAKKEESLEDRLDRIMDQIKDDENWEYRVNDELEDAFSEEELEELGAQAAAKQLEKNSPRALVNDLYKMLREDEKMFAAVYSGFIREYGEFPSITSPLDRYKQDNWLRARNQRLSSTLGDGNYTVFTKSGDVLLIQTHEGERLPKGLRLRDILHIHYENGWYSQDSTGMNSTVFNRLGVLNNSIAGSRGYLYEFEKRLSIPTRIRR